jgi:hypothetical protein
MPGGLGSGLDVVSGQAGGLMLRLRSLSLALTLRGHSLPPMTLPIDQQVDDLLDTIATLTSNARRIDAELADAKATLTQFVADGLIDQAFSHNDWSFTYNKGRTTFDYSDEAKRAIKQLQEADKAMGRAVQKQGASYWTIKPPAI